MFTWGALWWLVAGGREIDRFVRQDAKLVFVVAFLSVSGLAFGFAARSLSWPRARIAARVLLPLLLACAVGGIAQSANVGGHLFANGGAFAQCPAAGFEQRSLFAILLYQGRRQRGREHLRDMAYPGTEFIVLVWIQSGNRSSNFFYPAQIIAQNSSVEFLPRQGRIYAMKSSVPTRA